jgi:membrane-associated phospholipid phosphatase
MDPDATPLPVLARVKLSVLTYVSCMSIYYAAGLAARSPHVVLATRLDDAIPFEPQAMAGYALAYVVPVSLLWVEVTEAGMRRLLRAVLLAYAIAAPFFIFMPIASADPRIEGTSWGERLLLWNRAADTTKNAFPSMHVGLAVLLALIGWRRSRAWGTALGACAAVIAVSTLLVKQHFLADIPAGALVAVIAFRAVYGAAE